MRILSQRSTGGANASWIPGEPSVVVIGNIRFHKTEPAFVLFETSHHILLFLPTYSPDFNPIENNFANIKKHRQFAPTGTPLNPIIQSYVSYLE